MLKLYNKEHVAVAPLTNLKDYKIEYLLNGEDLLEFSLSRYDENISIIEEECYIRTKHNEYVVKAIEPSDNFKRFTCNINIESLVGKIIKNFDTNNNNLTDTIRLAIAGTGWILEDNNITKTRTIKLKNTNALEVLREVRKVFRVDYRFDAINKIIHAYENLGSDKGVYFSDELNLISLNVPSDSYDYATRLYARGKDGITFADINNGKDYIENFQYSNKIIEKIWEDNRYTNKQNLKEDAQAKLEELSKPRRNYNIQVYDLAKNNSDFSFLDFFLGDTVTIISNLEKFKDKQRIVKYIEHPNDPSKNSCELGNTTLTFEELQKENEAKNKVVDNTTIGNGIINGESVDSIKTEQISDFEASVAKITDLTVINAKIENLTATNVTITGELNAVKANIGTLVANVATIDSLTVTHTAQINNLIATSATITQLNAVSATINTLEVEVGKIETLVNGNLSSENIQSGGITSDKLTIANGFIKNAMIDNVDVAKINAGDISTNKFKIKSDDGGIEIVGATQQFKDKNNKVRIQMGKDTQGNFNFIIRGEDGTTTLIDHTGIKAKAIADDLIVNNMIASDAVGEKQINYSSFSKGFNKDTNATTLKATKIRLDNQNQTLEVAFNSLKTQADGTKSMTESHSTTISVMQGQISTAINNTHIIKDGQTILLKDDYNRTLQTVDSMKSTIGSHTTQINQHTGQITGVETRVNTVERNLNSITARVSSTETNIINVNNKIDNVQIGGRNFVTKVKRTNNWESFEGASYSINEDDCPNGVWLTGAKGNKSTARLKNIIDCNGWWTISFYLRGTQGAQGGFLLDIADNNSQFIQTTVDNQWKKVILSVEVKNYSPDVYNFIDFNDLAWQHFLIKDLKVEKGNKATDWSPAPEDVDDKITTTNNKVSAIEVNLNNITSKVSSVETTTSNILNASSQNLLSNSDFRIKNGAYPDGWYVADANKIKFDSVSTLLDGYPSFYFNVTGETQDSWLALYSPFTEARQGEKFTASIYVLIAAVDVSSFDRGCSLEIEYFNKDDTRIKTNGSSPDFNKRGWQRIVCTGVAPDGTRKVRIRMHPVRNGKFNASKPMLQLGDTVTGWQKGFDINRTEVRLRSAEQKITDSSIISTVSSQFYKKGETDSRYAAQSQIEQLAHQITSKVDVNGVKSVIQQNPNDVMIGFNGINNRISINPRSMDFTAVNGNRDMLLYGGQVCIYNNMDNKFLATVGSVVNDNNTFKGTGFLLSKHCTNFVVGRDSNWDDVLTNRSPQPTHAFDIDFANYRINVLYGMSTGEINMRNNSLYGVNVAYIKDLYTFGMKHHNTGKDLIVTENDRLKIKVPMSFDGNDLMNPTLYTNKLFFTNGQLAFGQHSSGANIMMNGVHWDWQGFNIVNARFVGSQMSYSLIATSPGMSVGADTASVETMLLQEDFSKYDELNNAVIVDMNEGFKSVYAKNKKLENENEQLKQENEKLNKELSMTKNALDIILMNAV